MLTTGSSFSLHPASSADAKTVAPAGTPKHHFSFGDFLDIVNPLQHLPIVGTLYRAITGDRIGTPEKLVGDAVYGGPWGLVSSLADTAFESATGKDFGDTVLGLFTGHHGAAPAGTEVAQQTKPAASATTQPASATPAESALAASLNRSGAGADTAQRALFAYRRMMSGAHPSAFGAY